MEGKLNNLFQFFALPVACSGIYPRGSLLKQEGKGGIMHSHRGIHTQTYQPLRGSIEVDTGSLTPRLSLTAKITEAKKHKVSDFHHRKRAKWAPGYFSITSHRQGGRANVEARCPTSLGLCMAPKALLRTQPRVPGLPQVRMLWKVKKGTPYHSDTSWQIVTHFLGNPLDTQRPRA